MSFVDTEFDLTQTGFISINGINKNKLDSSTSNGSGKSALWESIIWCLTGETVRGTKNVCNLYCDDGCYVELSFIVDNNSYVIIRSKNHSTYKTDLKIYINDEDKSGKGIRDSEKLLKEYLPDLDAQLIGSVVILGQGLPQRFTDNTPAGRKEILEKLSKSDFMIDDLKERVSTRKSYLDSELNRVTIEKAEKSSKLSLLKEQKAQYERQLEEFNKNNDFAERIKELEEQRVEYINKKTLLLEKLTGAKCNRDVLDVELSNLNAVYNESRQSIEDKYSELINDVNCTIASINADINSLNREIDKANNMHDTCPLCKQKIVGFVAPDVSFQKAEIERLTTQRDDAMSNKAALKSNKDNEVNMLTVSHCDKIKQFEIDANKYNEIVAQFESEYAEIKSQLLVNQSQTDNLRAFCDDNRNALISQIADIDSSIKSLDIEVLKLDSELSDINSHISVVSKFITYLNRDFRGYLLKNIIDYIGQRSKFYSKFIFDTELVDFFLEGNCINITYNKKMYENLSGGEKQKIDLIVQFSLRDMLSTYMEFSSNILVLDEIFDNLDSFGCQKVITMINEQLNVPSIYIVSHHTDELDIPFDSKLSIVKDENGVSSIIQ